MRILPNVRFGSKAVGRLRVGSGHSAPLRSAHTSGHLAAVADTEEDNRSGLIDGGDKLRRYWATIKLTARGTCRLTVERTLTPSIPATTPEAVQSPVAAFEQFVDIVRGSRGLSDVDPDAIRPLLRPFLANPHRDDAPVREIVSAIGVTTFSSLIRSFPGFNWLFPRMFGPMEKWAPQYVARLTELEAILKNRLIPGSVTIHVMPARFLEKPSGFGQTPQLRYRLQVQTLIDVPEGDHLEAVSLEVRALSQEGIVFEEISPTAAFSSVTRKNSTGAQTGLKRTATQKNSTSVNIGGAKGGFSSSREVTGNDEVAISVSSGAEQTSSTVEQYLIARMAANRAVWRVIAGVGPIDPAGLQYTVDLLAPPQTRELALEVDARIEWHRAGAVPAELRQRLLLPSPDDLS
ncbi:hypothetical protein [Brevundimonas basaltis]|nr:hypothetical protein [Brevundimonas basaltis]